MTSEEFIRRIRIAVYDSSVEGTFSLLEKPPCRRPAPALIALSQWFNQLPFDEKEHIEATIRLAVRNAIFGMLTVLDGVRSIREAGEEVGSLELRYNLDRQSDLLNDPTGEFLHDLFAEQVPLA
jgi:hypothetical protein